MNFFSASLSRRSLRGLWWCPGKIKPGNLHHIWTLDSVLHFTHGQLLVGEVVVGAVDVMWKQISDKFISTNSFYIILKSIHVPFKHHIPNCWHVAWTQEPKADSYFYIFLLKKKRVTPPSTTTTTTSNNTTMTDDAFPAEWMEKHCHVLTSPLFKTRGSALEKEREPIAEARCGSIFIFFLIQMILFHCSRQNKSRNKWWFSFVYSLHGPNVCTYLIGTINRDKAEASWWVVAIGLMPRRFTWKLKVGGVQGNAVAKRASCLFSYQRFFFSPCWCFNNDSAHRRGPSELGGLASPEIWMGLCSNCSSHPEIWSSTQKHWCALSLRAFQVLSSPEMHVWHRLCGVSMWH